jgi:cytochrome c biogenesis protein ResB
MKKNSFSLLILIILLLITATILEKLYGTPWVASNIYGSTWFLLLWGILTISALIYIFQRRLYKRPITLLLHLSFVVILIGAAITHYFGINGQIHLRLGKAPKSTYIDTNYEERNLPFAVSLNDFQLIYYPGTTNPMDFVSHIEIHETPKNSQLSTLQEQLSMNNILKHRNYRFYQSSYDSDHQGSVLSIYHDPYGITLTYIGYFLLFASMTLFLLNKYLSLRKKEK